MGAFAEEGMRGTPGLAGRVFTAISRENTNIIAIAQGSSESNISFVVASQHMSKALAAVHREFSLDMRNANESAPAAK